MSAEARRTWARPYLDRAQKPLERFGSPGWHRLPEGPEKVASVIVAALAWAADGDDLPERLAAEIGALRQAGKADDDSDYVTRRDAHRAAWNGKGFRPDPAIADEVEAEFLEWIGGEAS